MVELQHPRAYIRKILTAGTGWIITSSQTIRHRRVVSYFISPQGVTKLPYQVSHYTHNGLYYTNARGKTLGLVKHDFNLTNNAEESIPTGFSNDFSYLPIYQGQIDRETNNLELDFLKSYFIKNTSLPERHCALVFINNLTKANQIMVFNSVGNVRFSLDNSMILVVSALGDKITIVDNPVKS